MQFSSESDAHLSFGLRYETQVGDGKRAIGAANNRDALQRANAVATKIGDFSGPPKTGVRLRGTYKALEDLDIRSGDVLVAIDGVAIPGVKEYLILRSLKAGPTAPVIVWRQSTKSYAEVVAPVRRLHPAVRFEVVRP